MWNCLPFYKEMILGGGGGEEGSSLRFFQNDRAFSTDLAVVVLQNLRLNEKQTKQMSELLK